MKDIAMNAALITDNGQHLEDPHRKQLLVTVKWKEAWLRRAF